MTFRTIHMRKGTSLALLALSAVCFAQTPPIKPQTPDVRIPPPVTLPAAPAGVEALGAQPLTVDEAAALAVRRVPAVAIARANVEAAAGRTEQTQSGLLPQLSATGGLNEQRQVRGVAGGANRFSLGVGAEQLLFDFGRTRSQVRQSQAFERATRFGLGRTEHEVALQARLAFVNYAEAVRLVEVSDANVANRLRQLQQAEARVDAGIGAPADMVRAKTNLADAVLSLELARSGALNSRVLLAERLGVDPRTPITPATTESAPLDVQVEDVNGMVEMALTARPEILEAQQRLLAAGIGVAVARLVNAPRVTAVADLNSRGVDNPLDSVSTSIGLFVSWNFFDGGRAAGVRREAQAEEQVARATLQEVSQTVVSDVSRASVDVRTAQQRVETADVQVANAVELLRISEGRYQGGIGQFLEVTDAQASLFTAQRNLTQAQSDLRRAQARLRRSIGRP